VLSIAAQRKYDRLKPAMVLRSTAVAAAELGQWPELLLRSSHVKQESGRLASVAEGTGRAGAKVL
jgi:hypothetical protein